MELFVAKQTARLRLAAPAVLTLLVSACGSSGETTGLPEGQAGDAGSGAAAANGSETRTDGGGTQTFSIGGSVTGLKGSGLVLQNNAGDDLPVLADGTFAFATMLGSGSRFGVTVKTQPLSPKQGCSVLGGSGTVGGENVTTVVVNCQTNTYPIGGSVTGLSGSGLELRNNGGAPMPVNASGAFTFPVALPDGSDFAVTVDKQPTGPKQTCDVTSGAGKVSGDTVTTVAVTCVTDRFTVGGTVSGLLGAGLALRNNGGDELRIDANGPYVFPASLPDLSPYAVVVQTLPSGNQTCTAANASGALKGAAVTNVDISCVCNAGWHLEGMACVSDKRSCAIANGTGSQTWSAGAWGACTVASCTAGFANCDGDATNGCEVNTSTSASHCGACNTACGTGKSCYSGLCSATCPGNTTYTSPVAGCTNVAPQAASFSASSSYPGAGPSNAGDANSCTAWNSGGGAPATWQVDLGAVRSIAALTMVPSMLPSGAVQHIVEGSIDGIAWTQVLAISQSMSSGALYNFTLAARVNARHVRVRTVGSPSWVSWIDVNVWANCP
jgi:hypothetical protein